MMMRIFLAPILLAVVVTSAAAQGSAALQGRLVNSLSGDPIAGAAVVLDEARRETVSGSDGTFRFDNLAPFV